MQLVMPRAFHSPLLMTKAEERYELSVV